MNLGWRVDKRAFLLHDFIHLDMTEKLLFRFADTLVWNDGVIPAWQNTMRLEINKCLLCV